MSAGRGRRPLVFALAVVAAAGFWSRRPEEERVVLPAVEAEAFRKLAAPQPAAPELWERLKAMGVGAVILREETASELVARAEALHFTRAEVEKWRALGLIPAGAGPKPDSLWAKDVKTLSRLSAALAARGVDVSTASAAGGRVLELPPGVDLALVPAGFDPGAVSAVSAAGLIPVAASTGPTVSVAGQRLWIRTLPAAARPPELLRAVYGRTRRLLILRPSPGLGLEDNLELLRSALKVVKDAGLPSVLPAAPEPAPLAGLDALARLILFYAVGALGPLLAARAGLHVERRVRAWVAARAPIAAPVPEVLAGLAAVWAAASGAGLLAAALPDPAARETLARGWILWTLSAPLALGAAALFAGEGAQPGARWGATVRVRDLAAAGALALALACLLAPRAFLRVAGVWESVDRLSAAADLLWWWPWRWREMLIGVPSLVIAMILVDADEARGPRPLGDPRGWLAFGLLAPAGTVAAVGAGNVPAGLAVAQGAAAFGLGAALGLALSAVIARIEMRAKMS